MQTQGNKNHLTPRHNKPSCGRLTDRLHFVVSAFQCILMISISITVSAESCTDTIAYLLLACAVVSNTTRERYYNHFHARTYAECIKGTCHNFSDLLLLYTQILPVMLCVTLL